MLPVVLSVCPLVDLTNMYFAKVAESIDTPFRVVGRVELRYHVYGDPTSPHENRLFEITVCS